MSMYSENTYVYVPSLDASEIIGYFSLVPDPIALKEGAQPYAPLFAQFVTLSYLAVDKQYQRMHYGRDLLIYVMGQVLELNDPHIDGLVLEPVDEGARAWFQKLNFGFEYIEFPEPGLLLPIHKIRDAFS